MDTQRAIEMLEYAQTAYDPCSYGAVKIAIDKALEALRKQIPIEPLVWEEKYYYSPTPNDDWGYECPCCGNREIDYPEHHCTCGQALNWDSRWWQ